MKKIGLFLIVVFSIGLLMSCTQQQIAYTDNEPLVLHMSDESLKILQITDLHLTYGIDYMDQKTFDLIRYLNAQDTYDLIVISGDMTMSPQGPRLFSRLIDAMESLKTPWTFIFGNHETDYHNYQDFLKVIGDTTYLYFKVGPLIASGGVGNFKIDVYKDNALFYHLYFLDTKSKREDYTEDEGAYDYLSLAQVEWYETHVAQDTEASIAFMHIPLRQYIEVDQYIGTFNEKKVYAQGVDTGFFDAMVHFGKTKAVFVGHDHLNDFLFYKQDIMLAYGRATGFNGYGTLEKGGRHIEIDALKNISTHVLTYSEVRP